MFKGPDYGQQRYNGRLNLSLGERFNFSNKRWHMLVMKLRSCLWTEWIIEQATRMPAIYPIKDENGAYNLSQWW